MLKVIEESEKLPIALEEVRLFLKVDYEDEDSLIIRSLKTALKQCELHIGLSLLHKKYQYSIYNQVENRIRLLYGPVKSVESVKILNDNGQEIFLEASQYIFDEVGSQLIFKNIPNNFYRMDIIYDAGLDKINEDLKQAILFHTAKIFEDKLGYSPIPRASYSIYRHYKSTRL